MDKQDINNKLQFVFEGLSISKEQKRLLSEVFTYIIDTAISGENPDLSKYLTADNIPAGTASKIGGIKSKTTGTASNRDYYIEILSDGTAKVNVPWADNNTTYKQATSGTLGLVKIGYSTSGKNYAVQLDSNGKMYVNVPWTDTIYSEATTENLGLVKQISLIEDIDGVAELSTVISTFNTLFLIFRPTLARIVNNNISKLDSVLKLVQDKDGNIDIEGIMSETIDNLLVAKVKQYPDIFGGMEIGEGTIKINIPFFNKSIVFDTDDIESLKQTIIKK